MSTPTGWRMSVFIWVDASTPVPVQWSTRLHPRKGVPIWVETSSAMVRPILRAENSPKGVPIWVETSIPGKLTLPSECVSLNRPAFEDI